MKCFGIDHGFTSLIRGDEELFIVYYVQRKAPIRVLLGVLFRATSVEPSTQIWSLYSEL